MTHEPDKSKIPQSLQSLDWQPMQRGLLWYDGTEILAAVPVRSNLGNQWRYEFDVVRIDVDDDFFHCDVNGESWGWDLLDAEWYVVIRGQKPEKE